MCIYLSGGRWFKYKSVTHGIVTNENTTSNKLMFVFVGVLCVK